MKLWWGRHIPQIRAGGQWTVCARMQARMQVVRCKTVQRHQRRASSCTSGSAHILHRVGLSALGSFDRRPDLEWRLIAIPPGGPPPAEALFGRRWHPGGLSWLCDPRVYVHTGRLRNNLYKRISTTRSHQHCSSLHQHEADSGAAFPAPSPPLSALAAHFIGQAFYPVL
jgi:hypothetical protein